jgi:hypothetical protein
MKTLNYFLIVLALLLGSCTKKESDYLITLKNVECTISPMSLDNFEYMTTLSKTEAINYIETSFPDIVLVEDPYSTDIIFDYDYSTAIMMIRPVIVHRVYFDIYGKTGFAKNVYDYITTSNDFKFQTTSGGVPGEYEEIGKAYVYTSNINLDVAYYVMVVYDPDDWYHVIEGGELYYYITLFSLR